MHYDIESSSRQRAGEDKLGDLYGVCNVLHEVVPHDRTVVLNPLHPRMGEVVEVARDRMSLDPLRNRLTSRRPTTA